MIMLFLRKISLCILLALLTSCATGHHTETTSGVSAKQGFQNGVCQSEHEWGGFEFDIELRRVEEGMLDVHVDMSRTKWDAGVVEAWLELGGEKVLPEQASKGAVTEHPSSNTPAAIAGAGLLFDQARNKTVGSNSHVVSAVTAAVGVGMGVRNAEKRKKQFDLDTTDWSGLFYTGGHIDCSAKLWVRYWMPQGGLAGWRGVDVGHCFCQ